MTPLSERFVTVEGELRGRIIQNFGRLHDRIYRAGMAGLPPCCSPGWPGDWEGRALLALIHDSESLHCEAAYIGELIAWIRSLMNDEGYRSEPNDKLDLTDINEQMHSSHNWLLRALMACYRRTGDAAFRDEAAAILRNLYLPIRPHLIHYPKTAQERAVLSDKAVIGHFVGHHREWRLSGDTGCIFMCFDALGEAWDLFREEPLHGEIGRLIDTLLDAFRHMDYVGSGLQTHATLTCMRGLMRVYRVRRDPAILADIERCFADYLAYGMTATYENINNFAGAVHTEPCAIVDSYMLACQLWEETGNTAYLACSHKIWWSALMRTQRANGGFGCDWPEEDGVLRVVPSFYEAYWCCSMRGAEGLGYPVRHALYRENNTLTMPFYFDFTASLPGLGTIGVATDYPASGRVTVTVRDGNGGEASMRFYLAPWMKEPRVTCGGETISHTVEDDFLTVPIRFEAGKAYLFSFRQTLTAVPCERYWHAGKGLSTLEYGPSALGCDPAFDGVVDPGALIPDGRGGFSDGKTVFEPLYRDNRLPQEENTALERRILFRAAPGASLLP